MLRIAGNKSKKIIHARACRRVITRARFASTPWTALSRMVADKPFDWFYYLPAELRMVVINHLPPEDRCRFSQASNLSLMEVRRSNEYMQALELHVEDANSIQITVTYQRETKCGYILHYTNDSDKKYMKYRRLSQRRLSKTELNDSVDLVQLAADQFKSLLQTHQHVIKGLKVHVDKRTLLRGFDFGFENLRKLENLDMKINSDITEVTSKLRKPLKSLCVYGKRNNRKLKNFEMLLHISKEIHLPYLRITYDQYCQLSADCVVTHIGEITEEEVYQTLHSWKNQPTEGGWTSRAWNMRFSEFDFSKLLKLVWPRGGRHPTMEIEHRFEEDVRVELILFDSELKFLVKR